MSTTTERPDELTDILEGDFLSRNDRIARLGMTISTFQNIPGLVGFWPMSSVQRSTGNAYDLSGQGRLLTYNGNPTYNIENDLVPYIDFDGTGDLLARADETDLDILGTETIYNSSVRGLTIGGWFNPDRSGTFEHLTGKEAAGVDLAYVIFMLASPALTPRFDINGSVPTVVSSVTTVIGQWHFIVGRYVPSLTTDIYVDNIKTTQTIGVPAVNINTASSFSIGSESGGAFSFDGQASLCFLSANALADAYINALFQQSRVLFGV